MAPNHALMLARAAAKRWEGYVQAGLLSREIKEFGVPTRLTYVEGNIVGGGIRESPADPARSGEPGHVRSLHAREPGGPMFAHSARRIPPAPPGADVTGPGCRRSLHRERPIPGRPASGRTRGAACRSTPTRRYRRTRHPPANPDRRPTYGNPPTAAAPQGICPQCPRRYARRSPPTAPPA